MELSMNAPARLQAGLLASWHTAMDRAGQAARQGQILVAMASYQEAVAIARSLLAAPAAQRFAREDDCVAALVVSSHNLAELQADAGGCDMAAAQLATAHEHLMQLLSAPESDDATRRAAWRHSRETHAALLLYLDEHGPHPAIARALRAGCMALAAGDAKIH